MQALIDSWLKGNHKNLQTLRPPGNWVWHSCSKQLSKDFRMKRLISTKMEKATRTLSMFKTTYFHCQKYYKKMEDKRNSWSQRKVW